MLDMLLLRPRAKKEVWHWRRVVRVLWIGVGARCAVAGLVVVKWDEWGRVGRG